MLSKIKVVMFNKKEVISLFIIKNKYEKRTSDQGPNKNRSKRLSKRKFSSLTHNPMNSIKRRKQQQFIREFSSKVGNNKRHWILP